MSASSLQRSLRRLVAQRAGWEPVPPAPSKGARPGERAIGRPASAQAAQGVTLVESSYAARLYWPPRLLTSTDGIFTLEVEPIRQMSLVGDGTFQFQEPTEP